MKFVNKLIKLCKFCYIKKTHLEESNFLKKVHEKKNYIRMSSRYGDYRVHYVAFGSQS